MIALVGLGAYGAASGAVSLVWLLVALGALGGVALAVTGAAVCVRAVESLGAVTDS